MPGGLKYPILVHSMIEKKENTGSQMGHTKKKVLLKGLKNDQQHHHPAVSL